MRPATKIQRFGYWQWVVTRECANGHEMRLIAGDTRRSPSLPPGGTRCHCGEYVSFRGGN